MINMYIYKQEMNFSLIDETKIQKLFEETIFQRERNERYDLILKVAYPMNKLSKCIISF